MNKVNSNFYEKYVGSYAKKFYKKFEKENIFEVIGFRIQFKLAEVHMQDAEDDWWWGVEDCIFITNEQPMIEDERIANVFHSEYKGWNPFTKDEILNY